MSIRATLRSLHGDAVAGAIQELHHAENDLAAALITLSDTHRVEHEVFHVARDLARWSHDHVRRLAEVGDDYGLHLDPEPHEPARLVSRLRQTGSELTGRSHALAPLLLGQLRDIHQATAGVVLEWEVLGQAAQAMRDESLLAVTTACRPQSQRQLAWSKAKVKDLAAQSLVT